MSESVTFYTYRARARRVIDGDTLEVLIDQGFNDYTVKKLRLGGVDTAEIFGVSKDTEEYQLGMEQKEFTADFVEVDEHGEEEFPLSVRTSGKGKYGRWVARVWKDSECLNESLVEEWPDSKSEY